MELKGRVELCRRKRSCWRLKSSGMWRRVTATKVPDVSNIRNDFHRQGPAVQDFLNGWIQLTSHSRWLAFSNGQAFTPQNYACKHWLPLHPILCLLISVNLGEMNYWPTNNGSYLSCLPPRHQPSGPSVRPDTCWSSPASSVPVKASSPETVSKCHKRSLCKVNTIWCTTEFQNHTNLCSKLNMASCKLRRFWTRHRLGLERSHMS